MSLVDRGGKPPTGRAPDGAVHADAVDAHAAEADAADARATDADAADARAADANAADPAANGEPGERLQKRIARAGVASRRKAEELIRQGRVTVEGEVATLGQRVREADAVLIDGVELPGRVRPVTYLLNKPPGVLSTVQDDRGRRTVMDLVPGVPGLHPVGRLDLESEGALLLSNDGDLTLRLSHPRYGHSKEYRVWCKEGTPGRAALARLRAGVALDDGPAKARRAEPVEGGCVLVIAEGRNRQVRRMLAAVGYEVVRLQRTRIGTLGLGDLGLGSYRRLSASEVEALLRATRADAR